MRKGRWSEGTGDLSFYEGERRPRDRNYCKVVVYEADEAL